MEKGDRREERSEKSTEKIMGKVKTEKEGEGSEENGKKR